MRTLTTALLTLLLAASAQGKGILSAKACGQDGCVPVDVSQDTAFGGPSANPPTQAQPFVRLKIRIGVPGQPAEGAQQLLFLPDQAIARIANDSEAQWFHMDAPEPWVAAAREVTPFAAAQLPGEFVSPIMSPPPAPEPAKTGGDGFPWWIPAAVLGLAALLLAGTFGRRAVYGLASGGLGRGPGRARP